MKENFEIRYNHSRQNLLSYIREFSGSALLSKKIIKADTSYVLPLALIMNYKCYPRNNDLLCTSLPQTTLNRFGKKSLIEVFSGSGQSYTVHVTHKNLRYSFYVANGVIMDSQRKTPLVLFVLKYMPSIPIPKYKEPFNSALEPTLIINAAIKNSPYYIILEHVIKVLKDYCQTKGYSIQYSNEETMTRYLYTSTISVVGGSNKETNQNINKVIQSIDFDSGQSN